MRQLLKRLLYVWRRRRFDADLAEEIECHRAMKQRELQSSGRSPADAAHEAHRALGSAALAEDRARDVWCPQCLQGLGQDLRLAMRTLVATKTVTTVAILSLALGIGTNTAIFSLVNSLLVRALPVKNPQHVTLLTPRNIDLGGYTAGCPIRSGSSCANARISSMASRRGTHSASIWRAAARPS